MKTSSEHLRAFAALYGGVDAAVETLHEAIDDNTRDENRAQYAKDLIDEDVLQYAIDGRRLDAERSKTLDRAYRNWSEDNDTEAEAVERVAEVLDAYPELLKIFDNDGIAEKMLENEKFTDIFHRDPTIYQKTNSQGRKLYYTSEAHTRTTVRETSFPVMECGGGIYPKGIDAIVEWTTKTQRGTERKRQRDLSSLVEILEQVDYDLTDRDNKFWRWFREIYGD